MWLMSTFEKGNQKKIFFVSTFLDWYIAQSVFAKIGVKNGFNIRMIVVFFGI